MGHLEKRFGSDMKVEPGECKVAASKKDAVTCTINTEIGTVLVVMRKNVRWGGRFQLGDDQLEHSLILSLKSLQSLDNDHNYADRQVDNGNISSQYDAEISFASFSSHASTTPIASATDETADGAVKEKESDSYDSHPMKQPYGVPCMVEIFHFLCTLLDVVENVGMNPGSNNLAFDEDVPLFALGLINSVVKLVDLHLAGILSY
ncbi:hypothetical protein Nepgr_012221 [Nepenthes gracilis]|uniref:Uncharacterized protein n=1 Tax=Nepenthes gracilis TaxID=150966 RepID=A0AAD3XN60_NEPGR|nr:hypothetical protein Nepgr_012221 [Nepenthes gracilis]